MKTALVTGAGKRIGKAIADRLLDEGMHLVVHAHASMRELYSWVKSHKRADQVIDIVDADLSTEDGQHLLVNSVKKKIEKLDLLVNNASTFYPVPFAHVTRDAFREMVSVNLEAPFFITQGLLPELKKGDLPSVINILDAMWDRPSPKFSHYAASKAGLAILTRALAVELAPDIRVNGVAPGAILFQPFHTEAIRDRIIERIPQKKLGDPKDIADAVVYLSQRATYAVGEIFVIDGGRSVLA